MILNYMIGVSGWPVFGLSKKEFASAVLFFFAFVITFGFLAKLVNMFPGPIEIELFLEVIIVSLGVPAVVTIIVIKILDKWGVF